MPAPSPRSHLYRLAIVLVAGLFTFLGLVVAFAPSSWNYELDYWHRADSLEDMKRQPAIYGGIADISVSQRNESCKSCHEKATTKLRKLRHKGLSCESCHGALLDHVRDGKKIAAAKVDKSRWQCLNCHAEQINRPEGFPQFSKLGEIGKFVRKHKDLDEVTLCLECHDAHDPTP